MGDARPQIVILISGRGSNMRAIIEACREGRIDAEIAAVLSNNPDAPGLAYAAECGIPVQVLNHRDFDDRDEYDRALAALIEVYEPDLICLAGFMRILGAAFVECFEGRILNIHPSLLPKYKGLHTHRRAIEAGDAEAGCSVHIVTAALDDGPVLVQTKVPVMPDDTEDTLAQRVLGVEHESYIQGIQEYFRNITA